MRNFLSKNSTLIIFLVIAGFFVYAFNLHNGLFWDDDDWIINNSAVHSLSWSNIKFWLTHNVLAGIGLKSNYYRPFLFFTFAINYIIGGIKPLSYHLLSNLLHIGNAILIFYILFLATRKKLVVFLTAFFFLIHPLQTEAVTYISGRGDLLTAFFMLLALLTFFMVEKKGLSRSPSAGSAPSTSSVRASSPQAGSGLGSWQRWLSLVFLVLALLSRETAIIFPLLLMVFYITLLSGGKFLRSLKTAFIKALPYFAVVFTYGVLRLTVLNFKNVLNFYDQPNIYSSHLYIRIFTFLKVLLVYFKLLIIPTGLHMERSMDPQLSFWNWPVLLSGLIIAGLAILLFYLYRKEPQPLTTNYKLQTTNFRVWLFGIGWFFIALAPVSGITPINALIYEHWLYLPMIGFWFIIAYYLAKLFDFIGDANDANKHANDAKKYSQHSYGIRKLASHTLIVSLVIYFSFLGYQSIKRNILWGKPIPFYEDILKYEPDSVRINNNLGNMYSNEGNVAKAEGSYRKAVASEDIFPQPHFNLGSILQSKGDIFGAVQEYKKALEIDPSFYYAYQNLVSIYAQQGDLSNAVLMLEKLKELRPSDPRIYYNLGLVYIAQNKRDLALENLNLALKLSSNNSQASAEIKKVLEKLGK